ncbi:MAG TPA: PAAR domain-containing protein, partial [Methanosarcina sp.]|nr:PAAR domain-containing protein [Methanosarcina sp.]
GSPTVFINGRPVHRVGDHWMPHTCPAIPQTHDSFLAAGSPTVFVNGKAVGRIGDAIACGSLIMTGSTNVFAG